MRCLPVPVWLYQARSVKVFIYIWKEVVIYTEVQYGHIFVYTAVRAHHIVYDAAHKEKQYLTAAAQYTSIVYMLMVEKWRSLDAGFLFKIGQLVEYPARVFDLISIVAAYIYGHVTADDGKWISCDVHVIDICAEGALYT